MAEQIYRVKSIQRPVAGSIPVPGSKSVTNRALLLAALCEDDVRLTGAMFGDDARHFIGCLQKLGFDLACDEKNRTIDVAGNDGEIPIKKAVINVGSAGTAARFLTAMAGLSDGEYRIEASDQMKKRPMRSLFDALQSAGARIRFLEQDGHLPAVIRGVYADGKKEPDEPVSLRLDIRQSTQFLSALLLTSVMCPGGLSIQITSEKTTGSYIQITQDMIHDFGGSVYHRGASYEVPPESFYCMPEGEYAIEPDVSAACYFYAAAAVTGGSVAVPGVHRNLMQGDLAFLDVLADMGCEVIEEPQGIRVNGPADGRLHGVSVNMNNFSDQALTLAAIAPYADSVTEITGIGHVRGQESDRIRAMAENLTRLGIRAEELSDGIRVYPGQPKAARLKTYSDHRVAMAFALTGLGTSGVEILDPGCCAKTFPDYFEVVDRYFY